MRPRFEGLRRPASGRGRTGEGRAPSTSAAKLDASAARRVGAAPLDAECGETRLGGQADFRPSWIAGEDKGAGNLDSGEDRPLSTEPQVTKNGGRDENRTSPDVLMRMQAIEMPRYVTGDPESWRKDAVSGRPRRWRQNSFELRSRGPAHVPPRLTLSCDGEATLSRWLCFAGTSLGSFRWTKARSCRRPPLD